MVRCPTCGSEVDWVTAATAAKLLGVSDSRVRQLIAADRLPGAVKFVPTGGLPPLWKIPVASVAALARVRRDDGA